MSKSEKFPSFEVFFEEIHGFKPYMWQTELAAQVLAEGWPKIINIPTGLGKTSCIEIAIYQLARQVYLGHPRTAPMRIFHVIERRTVVDMGADHVATVADSINAAEKGPLLIIKNVLLRLTPNVSTLGVTADSSKKGSTFSAKEPAVVNVSFHGTRRDNRNWLRATGCTVVTLTAHQFMSRILFRGYGVTERTRSIHAGLCGLDRLVLFDEPHLCTPAVLALRDIERLQSKAERSWEIPLGKTVLLGASIPPEVQDVGTSCFTLNLNQETAAAQKRLTATRPFTLEILPKSADTAFVSALTENALLAWRTQNRQPNSIGVMVNTVALAQQVVKKLQAAGAPVRLVTSRVRDTDRQDRSTSNEIVVSTQCLEVGVDISFDVLITEACPHSSLQQRIGRLNRDGQSKDPQGILVTAKNSAGEHIVRGGTAAVYGEESVLSALKLLFSLTNEDNLLDMSLMGQLSLKDLSPEDSITLWGDRPRAATVHSGMIPLLSHTYPTPMPDVPLEAYISGPDKPYTSAEVSIAWRTKLDLLPDCPPLPSEEISVPIWALRSFLRKSTKPRVTSLELNDAGAATPAKETKNAVNERLLKETRILKDGEWETPISLDDFQAGMKVVLGTSCAGYSKFSGWNPSETATVPDHAAVAANLDFDQNPTKRGLRFPICKETLEPLKEEIGWSDLDVQGICELLNVPEDEEEQSIDSINERLSEFIPQGKTMFAVWSDRDSPVPLLELGEKSTSRTIMSSNGQNIGVVRLDEHCEHVAQWAVADAKSVGLKPDLTEVIDQGAWYHDCGKSEETFQEYLGAKPGSIPVAKSSHFMSSVAARIKREQLSFPKGWRHEALSMETAQQDGLNKLASHIVGSHHGLNRPFFPPISGRSQDRGVSHSPEFSTLNKELGPWGLAYLEAVVRLADWRASKFPEARPCAASELHKGIVPTATVRELPSIPDTSVVVDRLESPSMEYNQVILGGLISHPLSGWFATVGLLTAATELADAFATAHWVSQGSEGSQYPTVPVISSRFSIEELVEHICQSPQWELAETLMLKHTNTKLGIKNQKIRHIENVRNMLLEADQKCNFLILGLINDAVSGGAKKELAFSTVPFANNASYPEAALKVLKTTDEASIVATLLDPESGYKKEKCDGGMDRSLIEQPLVNGLGDHAGRQSRALLAPLVLYGMSGLGSPMLDGHGVTNIKHKKRLSLPLPTAPNTLEQLRSLMFFSAMNKNWDWDIIKNSWVLVNHVRKLSQYGSIWVGGIKQRSRTD